jgi:3'-phosphoadenosine 5'-phosphosulfate sulfotransferase (PAPS reductase)/FAD synthetase
MNLSYLDELEAKSIYIIREAYKKFGRKLGALVSWGKDSTTMLHLVRKAFFGNIPIPVVHIDTGYKMKEIYNFRDKLVKEWNINLIIAKNEDALKRGMGPEKGRFACCTALKTEALKQCIQKYGFKALLVAIRRDEHAIRAKERTFCFPEGTLVYGLDVKPIENIKVGDKVFTHLGSLKKVTGVSRRYFNGYLLSISSDYNLPLLLTPNHVVLAKVIERIGKSINVRTTGFDGVSREVGIPLFTDRIKWIEARKLKPGDWLWIPKLPKKPQDGIKTISYLPMRPFIGYTKGLIEIGGKLTWKSAHKSSPKIRKFFPLEKDVLRIIGYYVADGSSNLKSNQFYFAFNENDDSLIEDTLETVKEYFGLEGGVRSNSEEGVSVVFNSKILSRVFYSFCGKGPRNKHLPFFFTYLSHEKLLELIKGCWLGDGYHERYSTTSLILAHQIRLALLRLGILSSLKYEKKENRYVIRIAGISKERFKKLFGIKPRVKYLGEKKRAKEVKELSSKTDYGKCRSGGFWVKIRKMDVIPFFGYVYDLSIEGHQSYVVSGIAVHNSPRTHDSKWLFKEQPPELWEQFNVKLDETRTHLRVHPMLHWREIDIWRYIKRERIPVNPLYFSGTRKPGFRYRSLGCEPCCVPVPSNAKTIDEIIQELETTKIAERSGRVQDKEKAYMMLKLRSLGYM